MAKVGVLLALAAAVTLTESSFPRPAEARPWWPAAEKAAASTTTALAWPQARLQVLHDAKARNAAVSARLHGLAETCCIPSDVQVAAGPGAVVETVNSSVRIWTRRARKPRIRGTASLGAFFTTSDVDRTQDELGDARVLYDVLSRHWFVSVLDATRLEIDVGVSAGSAPGHWTFYSFPYRNCPDQPRLGISSSLVVFTVDLFSGGCDRQAAQLFGTDVITIDKAAMLGGQNASYREYGPDYRFPELTPVQSMSPTGTEYLVSTDADHSAVQVLSVRSWNGAFSWSTLTVRELTQPASAPQPGTSSLIDTGDNRVQNAVFQKGTLSLAATDGCGAGGTPQSCLRIVQIATRTMRVRTDYEYMLAGGLDAYYPALYPDARGDLVVVFGYSSTSDYPSVAFTVKPAAGAFGDWHDLARGSGVDTSGRYGDYFDAAPDPLLPNRIWIAGQFSGAAGWSTAVAALDMPIRA
jgi:hypothetical protein